MHYIETTKPMLLSELADFLPNEALTFNMGICYYKDYHGDLYRIRPLQLDRNTPLIIELEMRAK